jgi:uncharacterized membrane protein YphA (DoxX/SURF4 family)
LLKYYYKFPEGMLGVGFLILRTTAGVGTALLGGILVSRLGTTAVSQFSYFSHLILGVLLIAGSVFMILGLMLPFASIAAAACQVIAAFMMLTAGDPPQGARFGWIALALLVSITITLFFLGPGAYSIDARIYGRKRIFIPSSKKEDRDES